MTSTVKKLSNHHGALLGKWGLKNSIASNSTMLANWNENLLI